MEETKKEGMASVIAALVANILVAISKFVGFILSGSTAMMNESIHSVIDCGNQILLLVGDRKAHHQASDRHPFGEARAKYFYSTIVAMMLFFAGGALGIMEAVEKLSSPGEHGVENAGVVLGILVFGMIVEGSSLRVAFKEIAKLNKEQLPLIRFLKESRHSEILIIFAEDSCAVVGLVLALLGTILTMVTDNAMFDALSGLLIGIMLCLAALFLAREFYSLLIGESVTDADLATIRKSFDRKEVKHLIDIKTIHLSATDIMVTAKIEVDTEWLPEASVVINDIERQIRSSIPDYKIYIYIETDKYLEDYHRE